MGGDQQKEFEDLKRAGQERKREAEQVESDAGSRSRKSRDAVRRERQDANSERHGRDPH